MIPRPLRAVAPALLAVALTAGCGVRPTGAVDAGPAPIATANPSRYALYFVTKKGGYLLPEMREGDPSVPDGLLLDLDDGPRQPGMTTRLHGFVYHGGTPADRDGGTYQVTYLTHGGKKALSRAALGQIVCTLTARPPVQYVSVTLYHGGTVVHRWPPRTCRSFDDLVL